jgi:hypothetical protein
MEKEGREEHVHSPEGERGEGNPRHAQRDPRHEGDVLTPGAKVPNGAPPPPGSRERPSPQRGDRDEAAAQRGDRHEADPPQPQRAPEREVPPYAGGREQRGPQQRSGSAQQQKG